MDYLEAFENAIRNLGYGEAPERRLTPREVSELAREIAEREGIKYKSARRRLERRRTTGREARGQPNRRFANQIRARGLRVYARLELDVSPKDKRDMRERRMDVFIPGDALEGMAAALERGDLAAACAEFYEALFAAYEEADPDESFMAGAAIGEVFELGLSWGDSGPEVTADYSDLPF